MILLRRTRLPIVLAVAVALYALEAVTVGALVGDPTDAAVFAIASIEFELATPVTARGLYGRTREVTRVWLAPDDPSAFIEAVERRRPNGP